MSPSFDQIARRERKTAREAKAPFPVSEEGEEKTNTLKQIITFRGDSNVFLAFDAISVIRQKGNVLEKMF